MFKIGEVVSYSATGVCEIVDIRKEKLTDTMMQYYILKPIYQNASTVYVPVDNETLVSRMKYLLSKSQTQELIESFKFTDIEWIENDSERIGFWREILRSGDRKKIASLICTIHIRADYLATLGKQLRLIDAQILRDAKNVLHGEIATVFEIPLEEVETLINETTTK